MNDNKQDKQSAPVVPTTPSEPIVKNDSPKKEEGKKVEVDALMLQNLLNRVSELENTTKQIESTAPQDQIRKIEALRASGRLVKSVKVIRHSGKLVKKWKLVKDNVWIADGRMHEEQVVKIQFEDDTTQEMPLVQFTRGTLYEPYEVIKEEKNSSGDILLTVQLPEGKEFIISSQYIN